MSLDPIDCQVGDYGSWSECSATCGLGTKTKQRNVTVQPAFCGQDCPALFETESCSKEDCPGKTFNFSVPSSLFFQVICEFTDWVLLSECSVSCGNGTETWDRLAVPPLPSGKDCLPLNKTEPCSKDPCPGKVTLMGNFKQ